MNCKRLPSFLKLHRSKHAYFRSNVLYVPRNMFSKFQNFELNKMSGATVMGAREFLIAYNINLNTMDKRMATDIAFEIREKGRAKRRDNPYSPNFLDGEITNHFKTGRSFKLKYIVEMG